MPPHAVKAGRRYRYYVSAKLTPRDATPAGRRIRREMPKGWLSTVLRFLADRTAVFAAVQAAGIRDAAQQQHLLRRADILQQRFANLATPEQRLILVQLLQCVELRSNAIVLHLSLAGLVRRLAGNSPQAVLRRVGLEMKLLVEGRAPASAPDSSLSS